MKRMLLTISYDGTAYHGWQVQPNAITVQQVLQESLEKMLGTKTNATGCSRTDAGVHAREFYCHLDCADNIPPKAFLQGLNSILPNDISVIGCRQVDDSFHARYNAIGKEYVYGMYLGTKDPFLERYYLHLEKEPDIELMNKFADSLLGTHDFLPFSSSGRTVEDTVRTVSSCSARREGNKILFSITADGFLYNMVRIIAGTALAVSYGRLASGCAQEIFEKKDRSLGGDTLAPQGLFLNKVFYKGSEIDA